MNMHTLAEKRALGAYYTPQELSQVLSDWAIRSKYDSVLEPSFGGCGFFDSCINRLVNLGCKKPNKNIYGVDIDNRAFDILASKFDLVSIDKRFILADFIQVQPSDFSTPNFDVVIGNPPYVSIHNMSVEQRANCFSILEASPFHNGSLGTNPSLWAFFLLHSLSFLKEHGRIAWVLPSSLLHANYASVIINIYKKHFSYMKLIKLGRRFFKTEGADESTIVLIADGFTINNNKNCIFNVSTADDISHLLEQIKLVDSSSGDYENYKLGFISELQRNTYNSVSRRDNAIKTGDLFNVKIGMVTGANRKFILSESELSINNIPLTSCHKVIGKFSLLNGLYHNVDRHNKLISTDEKCFLLNPSTSDKVSLDIGTFAYLDSFSKNEISNNRTFKKRECWFRPQDYLYPDAYFSCMSHRGPRLVVCIGHEKINCTNSVHRVYFHENIEEHKRLFLAATMLSTYSQLSAEIEGRAYGSGVLKIEPTAAKNIRILYSDTLASNFIYKIEKMDNLVSLGHVDDATNLIDDFFLSEGVLTQRELCELKSALTNLRVERYKGVKIYNE